MRARGFLQSRKAEGTGPVAVIFLVIVFIINWALWLGKWLNQVGEMNIVDNNLVGVEAFFFGNLNLFVFIALILGIMAYLYFGGGE